MADLSPTGIAYGFSQLIGAPFQNPEILWIAIPLLITLIVVELNLAASSRDDYGLKQALPNAIVLFFVAIDLARKTFQSGFLNNIFTLEFFLSLLVFGLSLFVFLIEYYRDFPRKRLFGISAHLPINVIAYSAIVIVYNKTGLNLGILLGMIALMALFWMLFFFVSKIDLRRNDASNYSSDSGKLTWEKKKKPAVQSNSSSTKYEPDSVIDPFKGVKHQSKK